MDENELKTNGIPAEEPAETAESLEELPEKYDSDAEETTDDYEEAEAEPEAEEPAADDKPVKSSDGKKTEEELEAENEARCDEALLTEKFCLTYTLRFKDLAKFNLRYSLLGLSNMLFWLVLIISVAYLVTSWTALGAQKRALIIVLLIFLLWYVPLRAVINAAKSAAYLRNQSTPTEYHVCDPGFVICQEGQRGLLEYKKISRLVETKSTLYAYVFRNSGFIFPKDIVGERYEELRAILQANVGKK